MEGPRPEYEEFFRTEYPSVVRTVLPIVGELADAEAVTQDAFLKAVVRWGRIRRYDRPGSVGPAGRDQGRGPGRRAAPSGGRTQPRRRSDGRGRRSDGPSPGARPRDRPPAGQPHAALPGGMAGGRGRHRPSGAPRPPCGCTSIAAGPRSAPSSPTIRRSSTMDVDELLGDARLPEVPVDTEAALARTTAALAGPPAAQAGCRRRRRRPGHRRRRARRSLGIATRTRSTSAPTSGRRRRAAGDRWHPRRSRPAGAASRRGPARR